MTPQRILIVNPFGIGDVLFSTPLIRAVRRAFPRAYVAYLCNRRTEEILQRNQHLNEVFVYEKDEFVSLWKRRKWAAMRMVLGLLWRIKQSHFDLAIDLSLGERYSFLLIALGVRRRIGFDFRGRGRFLTHKMVMNGFQGRHVVDHYAELLETLGIHMREPELELLPTAGEQAEACARLEALGVRSEHVIGLVPAGGVSWGGQAHFRRWSKAGFIFIGRALAQRPSTAILIFGEPKDVDTCGEIAQAIGPAARDLSGRTSLGEFVSLIGCCDVVISNDGGPIHIAASQGVRTVSIFGPVDPDVYGPYPRTSAHQVVYSAWLPCRPCYHQFKLPPCPYERACLMDIEPEQVLEACEAVLGTMHEN